MGGSAPTGSELPPAAAGVLEPHEAAMRARLLDRLFAGAGEVRVGRYVLEGEIGRGGLGIVYAARDSELDRRVALKVIRAEAIVHLGVEQMHGRLRREAQAMAKVDHPNVVRVFDVGRDGAQLFISMEIVDGVTLKAWCDERPRSWQEVRDVLVAAGRGLEAAHAVGVVHRDFKPGNVLVDRSGRPRVLDFGLALVDPAEHRVAATADAARIGDDLTRTGMVLGTPRYMAPEQFAGGAVDQRTDQWAFCVTAYELLFGVRPFEGDTIEAVRAAVLRPLAIDAASSAGVPAEVRDAIARGLCVDPGDRHASMGALLSALGRPERRSTKRVVLVGGLAAACAAIAVQASPRATGPMHAAFAVVEPPTGATAGVRVSGLRALWSTPHQIRWAWDVEGEPDALMHYEIIVGPSAAAVGERGADTRRFGPEQNPELSRFLLPKTTGVDRVTATTTDGLAPGTQVFAQLVATDTAGVESHSNIAGDWTQESATHEIVVLADGELAGHSIPPGYELARDFPHRGDAHYRYDVHCGGPPECWVVIRRDGLGVQIPAEELTAGNYNTTAYLEIAIAVVGASPPWWSEIWLWFGDDRSRLVFYQGWTARADGRYHTWEVPLRAFDRHGQVVSHEDVTRLGLQMLAVSGSWTDGARVYVDEIRIRW